VTRDFPVRSFLTELGMRVGAATAVVAVFFGLGYLNRTNAFGLFGFLGNRLAFFGTAFLLVGLLSLGWVGFRRRKD
jgi:hypothetical protein